MNPAIWNQNGIDSGSESPESESIFSSQPESQSESIPHGNALLETESESSPVFLAESESISVIWDQAQVCPTQYEKCETSISFLNIASI